MVDIRSQGLGSLSVLERSEAPSSPDVIAKKPGLVSVEYAKHLLNELKRSPGHTLALVFKSSQHATMETGQLICTATNEEEIHRLRIDNRIYLNDGCILSKEELLEIVGVETMGIQQRQQKAREELTTVIQAYPDPPTSPHPFEVSMTHP